MIRIGIIGCGQSAQDYHIPALERVEDNKIVAVSDIEAAPAHRTAERLQNRSYDEPIKMVQQQCPDGCLVLTPPFVHRDGAEVSLETGCHVLCESPAVLKMEDFQAMLDFAEEMELNIMFSLPHRFSPMLSRIKELAATDTSAVLALHESHATFDTTADRIRYFGPGLYERGVLLFDMALWINGPIREKQFDRIRTGQGEYADTASARLHHENGATTLIHLNLNAGRDLSRVLLNGQQVWAEVQQGETARIAWREGEEPARAETFDGLEALGYVGQMEAFLHCCDKNRPVPLPPATTLEAVHLAREVAGMET